MAHGRTGGVEWTCPQHNRYVKRHSARHMRYAQSRMDPYKPLILMIFRADQKSGSVRENLTRQRLTASAQVLFTKLSTEALDNSSVKGPGCGKYTRVCPTCAVATIRDSDVDLSALPFSRAISAYFLIKHLALHTDQWFTSLLHALSTDVPQSCPETVWKAGDFSHCHLIDNDRPALFQPCRPPRRHLPCHRRPFARFLSSRSFPLTDQ